MSGQAIKRLQTQFDLAEQAIYLDRRSPDAAERYLNAAEHAFLQLAEMPGLGSVRALNNPRLTRLRVWRKPGSHWFESPEHRPARSL